jgi:hypothetical protein
MDVRMIKVITNNTKKRSLNNSPITLESGLRRRPKIRTPITQAICAQNLRVRIKIAKIEESDLTPLYSEYK